MHKAMQIIIYNNFVGARSLRNYYILLSIGRMPEMNNLPADIKILTITKPPANYECMAEDSITPTHKKPPHQTV